MTIVYAILGILVLVLLLLIFLHVKDHGNQKDYVTRKEDDQRRFNPIRNKKWWE